MKKLFVSLMVAVSALSMVVTEAQAKRMGGGGSFGKQSQSASRQAQSPMQKNQAAPAAQSAAPAAAGATAAGAAAKSGMWKGMLGGALLGLGLGALLSHLGIGGALAGMMSTILMVALFALAAMFIYRMVMRRRMANGGMAKSGLQPAYGAASAGGYTPEIGSRIEPVQPAAFQAQSTASGSNEVNAAPYGVPADFDTAGFLRHSKTYFIRLQAAWDRADANDVREFTTPEMFAEMKLQLQERGASGNHTDVVSLDAELLGVETIGNDYLASVKFSGMIQEAVHAPTEPFTEVWNLSKPVSGQGGWVLAGIQQLS